MHLSKLPAVNGSHQPDESAQLQYAEYLDDMSVLSVLSRQDEGDDRAEPIATYCQEVDNEKTSHVASSDLSETHDRPTSIVIPNAETKK